MTLASVCYIAVPRRRSSNEELLAAKTLTFLFSGQQSLQNVELQSQRAVDKGFVNNTSSQNSMAYSCTRTKMV